MFDVLGALAWIFFISIPLLCLLGAGIFLILGVAVQMSGFGAAVVIGVLLAMAIIRVVREDNELSRYWIALRNKELNNEPLTPDEFETLHPDQSWKLKYSRYYRNK